MALVDVTELLTDPDFVDEISIIRRTPFVTELGENQLREQAIITIGSVQPISGKTLSRLPEALRVVNQSSFWIKGEIISDGTCKYPDLLVFKGQRYAVQVIMDWMNFGQGYCEGVCVRERVAL